MNQFSITDSIILSGGNGEAINVANVAVNGSDGPTTINLFGTNLIQGVKPFFAGTSNPLFENGTYTPVTDADFFNIFDEVTTVDIAGTAVPTGVLSDDGDGVGQTMTLKYDGPGPRCQHRYKHWRRGN